MRKQARFVLFVAIAGLALRLLFLFSFPAVTDDSRLYADIAKNWLQHGVFGITDNGVIKPTFARLPGYPAFLAFVFAIFGADNYRAVLLVQVIIDLATCVVVADMARRTVSEQAGKVAFLITALCPFLATYSAAALSETLEIFFTAAALDFAVVGLTQLDKRKILPWLGCGAMVGATILVRPDGGILLASVEVYLAYLLFNCILRKRPYAAMIRAGLIVAAVPLAALIPWTIRNLHTLHRFQPLAPRYANEVGEFIPNGFNRWTKTWMEDYVSVQEIYWNVPGEAVDASKLPDRAFDSAEQRARTFELFDAYNLDHDMTPELDAGFAEIARERIRAHPLRYYLGLPVLRIADMWLRPRTELMGADPRWWEFNEEPRWSFLSVSFGIINLLYVLAAMAGAVRGRISWAGLFLAFILIRSAFLGSLENPEPRYTLECFPALLVLASAAWNTHVSGRL